MSVSDLPNWNLKKNYHGKRESDRAAMVFDCIDLPWLRLTRDVPRPTSAIESAIGHHITGVYVFKFLRRKKEKENNINKCPRLVQLGKKCLTCLNQADVARS